MSCQDHTNTDISDSLTIPSDISDSLTISSDISRTQITLSGSFGKYDISNLESFIVKYKRMSCIVDSVDSWSTSSTWCNIFSHQSEEIFILPTISRNFGKYDISNLECFIVKYKRMSCIVDSFDSWITSSKWCNIFSHQSEEIKNLQTISNNTPEFQIRSFGKYDISNLERLTVKYKRMSCIWDSVDSQSLRNTWCNVFSKQSEKIFIFPTISNNTPEFQIKYPLPRRTNWCSTRNNTPEFQIKYPLPRQKNWCSTRKIICINLIWIGLLISIYSILTTPDQRTICIVIAVPFTILINIGFCVCESDLQYFLFVTIFIQLILFGFLSPLIITMCLLEAISYAIFRFLFTRRRRMRRN